MALGICVTNNVGRLFMQKAIFSPFTNGNKVHGNIAIDALRSTYITISAVSSLLQSSKNVEIEYCGNASLSGDSGAASTAYCLLTMMLKKIPKKKYVLTGSVDLHGNICAVGAISAKCLVACRCGLTIVLSRDNEEDFNSMEPQHKLVEHVFIRNLKDLVKIIEGKAPAEKRGSDSLG